MSGSDQALEKAKAAAEAARAAAEAALQSLDQVSLGASSVASAVTGGAVDPFVFRLAIFVLAIFVGYYVVWSVTPALHTPLMSVTNAISSVVIVGALAAVGVEAVSSSTHLARGLGFLAVVFTAINIVGGLLVTDRMLAMYKKRETRPSKGEARS
jgi:NAD(P) transhydrogenase subunit alpha